MQKSSLPPVFDTLFKTAKLIVTYAPLQDEPDPRSILGFTDPNSRIVTLTQDPSVDPIAMAHELTQAHGNERTIILVPGQAFDAAGTRHGRGGGWFDRFLSAVPKEWIRIGVARQSQFSDAALIKQPWDEPMDWIFCQDGDAWNVCAASSDRFHTPSDTDRRTDQSPTPTA